jgi:carbamoyl-phosphate synthase large subunit
MLLTPEMHSTGEVMGIDPDLGMAYAKSQSAAGNPLPATGNVFLSVADSDKAGMVDLARALNELGYTIYATLGTGTVLRDAGIKCRAVFRISKGRPNALDMMADNELQWIVNIPSGASPHIDELKIRTEAVRRGVPITTTLRGLQSAVEGLQRLRDLKTYEVLTLQEYDRRTHAARRARGGGRDKVG